MLHRCNVTPKVFLFYSPVTVYVESGRDITVLLFAYLVVLYVHAFCIGTLTV